MKTTSAYSQRCYPYDWKGVRTGVMDVAWSAPQVARQHQPYCRATVSTAPLHSILSAWCLFVFSISCNIRSLRGVCFQTKRLIDCPTGLGDIRVVWQAGPNFLQKTLQSVVNTLGTRYLGVLATHETSSTGMATLLPLVMPVQPAPCECRHKCMIK